MAKIQMRAKEAFLLQDKFLAQQIELPVTKYIVQIGFALQAAQVMQILSNAGKMDALQAIRDCQPDGELPRTSNEDLDAYISGVLGNKTNPSTLSDDAYEIKSLVLGLDGFDMAGLNALIQKEILALNECSNKPQTIGHFDRETLAFTMSPLDRRNS